MLDRLKKKWGVGPLQLVLILCTFAIGGSLSGYAGKWLLSHLAVENRTVFVILYIIVVTLVWPAMVLMVSVVFGQYPFFKRYLNQLLKKLTQRETGAKPLKTSEQHIMRKKIAIFASGAGSNAQKIIDHFRESNLAEISLIACNKPNAGVLTIAANEHIESLLIEKEQYKKDGYAQFLQEKGIDFVVLAGFLWKIPQALIDAYPRRMINIHPALLPKYGGKGMYGAFVHESVIANNEQKSGITIHFVDEHYDNGDVIFQATCDIEPGETAESLAQKIHTLEHEHFPKVIEDWLVGNGE